MSIGSDIPSFAILLWLSLGGGAGRLYKYKVPCYTVMQSLILEGQRKETKGRLKARNILSIGSYPHRHSFINGDPEFSATPVHPFNE